MYVDDFMGGADTAEESGRLFHLFKRVLQEGGFSVHKFTTNDQQCYNLVDSEQNDLGSRDDGIMLLWITRIFISIRYLYRQESFAIKLLFSGCQHCARRIGGD